MISILEHIHNKGVIHRDIKPENFVLGKENERNSKHLYLIDFGFSKFFDKKEGEILKVFTILGLMKERQNSNH